MKTKTPIKEQIKGHWNEMRGKLQKKYTELSDQDLTYVVGSEDELIGRIQRKTGQPRNQIEKELESFCV